MSRFDAEVSRFDAEPLPAATGDGGSGCALPRRSDAITCPTSAGAPETLTWTRVVEDDEDELDDPDDEDDDEVPDEDDEDDEGEDDVGESEGRRCAADEAGADLGCKDDWEEVFGGDDSDVVVVDDDDDDFL